MSDKLYRSLGLPIRTWAAIESAKRTRISRDLFGRWPNDSETTDWLISLGIQRLQAMEETFRDELTQSDVLSSVLGSKGGER